MAIVYPFLVVINVLIHINIVLTETVWYYSRCVKIFKIPKEHQDVMKSSLSNMGCYNLFLIIALLIGLFHYNYDVSLTFLNYGLGCISLAGLWGAITVNKRILLFQTIPATTAFIALYFNL